MQNYVTYISIKEENILNKQSKENHTSESSYSTLPERYLLHYIDAKQSNEAHDLANPIA